MIDTLVSDLQRLLTDGLESLPEDKVLAFAERTARLSAGSLQQSRRDFTLRFSNIGTPCVRKLWLESRFPGEKVAHSPDTLFKFTVGHLCEEYLIFLIELAGHTVELRQYEVDIAGIKGHCDVVVDGMLLDVKSTSTQSFKKFVNHLTEEEDDFGYLVQLAAYHQEMKKLPEITYKSEAAFLVFDKQHGHLCLDVHNFADVELTEFFEDRKDIIKSDIVPDRLYKPKLDGYKKDKVLVPNGNEYLPSACVWCDLKFKCHSDLRVFKTYDGFKYYTKIVKEPKTEEVT